jgi:hypothetical protein
MKRVTEKAFRALLAGQTNLVLTKHSARKWELWNNALGTGILQTSLRALYDETRAEGWLN